MIARLLSQPPLKTPRLNELQSFLQLSAERGYEDANIFLEILKNKIQPVSEKPAVGEFDHYAA